MVKRDDELKSANINMSGTDRNAKTPGAPGVNPFRKDAGEGAGGVNPSGPTTGTEGWGIGVGEANTTGVGQGSLGKRPQHTEARRADDSGGPPGDRKGLEDAGRGGVTARTFRCADMGNADCRWETSGQTEDELLPRIERHARESHGGFDEKARRRVHDVLRERAA